MNQVPPLYLGVAAPLVERSRTWMVELPTAGQDSLRALQTFPRRELNTYHIDFLDHYSVVTFRTAKRIPEARVQDAIAKWIDAPPVSLPTLHIEPIPRIDHRRAVAELRAALQDQPIRVISRVGLTPQQLQRDLRQYRPEWVLLNAHGTSEGCPLLEDGRSGIEVVSGERLFPLLQPRPQVLFLSACYSGGVIRRAKDLAVWEDGAP